MIPLLSAAFGHAVGAATRLKTAGGRAEDLSRPADGTQAIESVRSTIPTPRFRDEPGPGEEERL